MRSRLIGLALLAASRQKLPDYRSIVVVAPHPDDEIIGLGGYLVAQRRISERITIVYLTDGEKSLEELPPEIVAGERLKLTRRVLARLGIAESSARWLHLPDGAVPRNGSDPDRFGTASKQLAAILSETAPEAVFVTHPLDTWPYDHVAAHELVVSALKQCAVKCDLYGYWVWLRYSMPLKRISGMRLSNVHRLDIPGEIREKDALMKLYLEALAPDGRPWSGVLPPVMLKVFRRPCEIVEKFPLS